MKIGILGGTFDPIHEGHIGIALFAIENKFVDKVLFIVSRQSPGKINSGLSAAQRFENARKSIENYSFFEVSDIEFNMPRPSYTIHTIIELKKRYKGVCFSLILGADQWNNFENWYQNVKILDLVDIIIFPRNGYEIDCTKMSPKVKIANAPIQNISSTQIRLKNENI